MAFRRRYYKRFFRKNPYRARKKVSRPVKRFVKSQINKNLEYKYHTHYYSASPLVAGQITQLLNITQDVTDVARIGDIIKLRTITFRYSVTAASASDFLRIIIFQMKENNSWSPNVGYVLNGNSPTFLSQYSVDNRPNYQILYDRTHKVDLDDPTTFRVGRVNMKYCKRKIQFYGGSSNNGTGIIYALAISNANTAPGPKIEAEINFFYTDA